MQTIELKLLGKYLQYSRDRPEEIIVVGDNADYYIHFDIDNRRTAMFAVFVRKSDKGCCYTESLRQESVLIDENGCVNIPIWVLKHGGFNVGIVSDGFASTPLYIRVVDSIIDKNAVSVGTPPPSEVQQLIELVNNIDISKNYENLNNLPLINGTTVVGNKSLEDYGIEEFEEISNLELLEILK